MWTFDGEEWIEEGGNSSDRKPEVTWRPEYPDVTPELQVIEIEHVPTTTRNNYVPPFPL